jgi:hypothetical protein
MYFTLSGERFLAPIMTSMIVNVGDSAACSRPRRSCATVSTQRDAEEMGNADLLEISDKVIAQFHFWFHGRLLAGQNNSPANLGQRSAFAATPGRSGFKGQAAFLYESRPRERCNFFSECHRRRRRIWRE